MNRPDLSALCIAALTGVPGIFDSPRVVDHPSSQPARSGSSQRNPLATPHARSAAGPGAAVGIGVPQLGCPFP
jgi:hypothetical protein